MLAGDLPAVAEAALTSGAAGLDGFHLQVGRPVQPMLAKTAPSLEAALDDDRAARRSSGSSTACASRCTATATTWAMFTRTLDPVGERMPEIAEAVRALPLRTVILDGEAIALRPDGRPRPFQETASRAASRGDVAALRAAVPLTAFFFDVLHLDGRDLLDLPGERAAGGDRAVAAGGRVGAALVTADAGEAQAFLDDALARGHEGVVVKALAAPYEAGRRGAGWLKVKPVHTLDLVVLAAEWGHGRRQGLLSNLHLGARDPDGDGFVMLGKTFKGLTDELLAVADGAAARARGEAHRLDGLRPPRAGRGDRVRRHPDELALSRRHGAALRARRPLPPRQARRRGRHDRHACARCTRRARAETATRRRRRARPASSAPRRPPARA